MSNFRHPAITPPKPSLNMISERELAMCKRAIQKRIEYCYSMIKMHPKTYGVIYSEEIKNLDSLKEKLETILNAM